LKKQTNVSTGTFVVGQI